MTLQVSHVTTTPCWHVVRLKGFEPSATRLRDEPSNLIEVQTQILMGRIELPVFRLSDGCVDHSTTPAQVGMGRVELPPAIYKNVMLPSQSTPERS